MKILHICLIGIVTDGFSYQDNLLPKYHKKMGNEVTIITNRWIYGDDGKRILTDKNDYNNSDNVHIIRLNTKGNKDFSSKFKRYEKLYENIEKISPDVIFIHGVQFLDMVVIAKYSKKHINVEAFADNHCDYSNSATNFISKFLLHRIIWKSMVKIISPYVDKFYGVLPARVEFLKENYGLSDDRCKLLVMGADDELVDKVSTEEFKNKFRKKLKIKSDEFLIVTGGKIDSAKTQTLDLMKAVHNINNVKIKLLVFGSVDSSMKETFDSLCDNVKVKYVGWANNEQSYEYFSIADLVVFPGRHSVYWEQVVAMGIPMICKYWDGTTHVDIGGNVKFLKEDSVLEIQNLLEDIVSDKDGIYTKMKDVAASEDKNQFLYSKIAKVSIEN